MGASSWPSSVWTEVSQRLRAEPSGRRPGGGFHDPARGLPDPVAAAGAALVLITSGGALVDNLVDGRGYLVLALTMFAR
jgi:hypothetical protein